MARGWRTAILILAATLAVLAGALALDRNAARRLVHAIRAKASGVVERARDAPPAPAPPTRLGLNLSVPTYYTDERAYANLALAAGWQIDTGAGYVNAGPGDFTADGALAIGKNLRRLAIYLARPLDPEPAPWIVCRYRGAARFTAHGDARDQTPVAGGFRFRWTQTPSGFVWLIAEGLDARDPLRALDCREPAMAPAVRFHPDFVAFVRLFKAVRFMGWQRVNANLPASWPTRRTLSAQSIAIGDGVPVEDMVQLAGEAGVDPWFTMPWNADADYIARFATWVRDHLPRDRRIYVEVGNEVWNADYAVSAQAQREGLERGLSSDPREAGLRRYAQKTIEVMRIWEAVFGGARARLVRVAATQHFNPETARTVLAFPGLAAHVDALATAPYFGDDLRVAGRPEDLAPAFGFLERALNQTIDLAAENRAIAARYGKRYIAYEGGQGVTLPGRHAFVVQIERDPRMYALYRRYIAAWRSRIGDTLTLLGSTSPITDAGWGLREYSGQPLRDAPKLRAVLDAREPAPPPVR